MIKIFRLMCLCLLSVSSIGLQAQTASNGVLSIPKSGHNPKPVEIVESPEETQVSKFANGLCPSRAKAVKARVAGNQQQYTQKLDSIVTDNYKQIYEYDENGNTTLYERYYKSGSSWYGNYKYEYAYDASGNRTLYQMFSWSNSAWVNYQKYEYEYDANGNETLCRRYNWSEDAWVGSSYYLREWDDARNCIKYEYYYWSDGEWVGNNKWECAYDANHNETMYAYYYWSDGAWVGSYRYTYGFDDDNVENSNAYYSWDSNLKKWYKTREEFWTNGTGERTYNTIYYSYDDGTETPSSKYVTIKNSKDIEIYEADYSWTDNDWKETTYTKRIYDGTIFKTDSTFENVDGVMKLTSVADITVSGKIYNIIYSSVSYTENDGTVQMEKTAVAEYVLQYDDNDNIIEYIDCDYENGQPSPNVKYCYAYDANGKQTLQVKYNWTDGDWLYDSKEVSQYDANGNQILDENYSYDSDSETFVGNYKYEYTYNDKNEVIMEASYNWSDGQWVGNSKYEYYHHNDSWYTTAHYTWDSSTQAWVGSGTKYVYEYDDNDNRTYYETLTWTNGDWQPNYKQISTYDANGNRTLYEYYIYDTDNSCYVGNYKYEETFNDNNQITLYSYYQWSTDDGNWQISDKIVYTYNEYNDLATVQEYDSSNEIVGTTTYTYDFSVPASSVAGLTGYAYKVLGSSSDDSSEYSGEKYYYSAFTSTFAEIAVTVKPGWNWISIPVENAQTANVQSFAESFGNIKYIASQTASLYNDETLGWFGDLKKFSATQGYKVNSLNSDDAQVVVSGYVNENSISLNAGWSWIGYNASIAQSVASALPTATEGDVIKSKDSFATYTDGAWVGDLTMTPGQGYKYQTSAARSISYNREIASSVKSLVSSIQSEDNSGFVCDNSKYSDNTAVIAKVVMTENPDRYVVGAFVDGECRGVSKLCNNLHFITVQGNEVGEKIEFRVYDTVTGDVIITSVSANFNGGIVGTVSSPVLLSLGNATGIENMNADSNTPAAVYDLQGRKLNEVKSHGVYITNGKKIIK